MEAGSGIPGLLVATKIQGRAWREMVFITGIQSSRTLLHATTLDQSATENAAHFFFFFLANQRKREFFPPHLSVNKLRIICWCVEV
jgi:hypothetical protein